jgi:hypothetical protein
MLNYSGVVKIMKKHDKHSDLLMRAPYLERVLQQPFQRWGGRGRGRVGCPGEEGRPAAEGGTAAAAHAEAQSVQARLVNALRRSLSHHGLPLPPSMRPGLKATLAGGAATCTAPPPAATA